MFDRACAEENSARARSQRLSNMAWYATGTANDSRKEEEEENVEENRKQPTTNPIGGSRGRGK